MYNVIGRCWDINFGGFLMKLKYTFNSIFKNHIKDFIFEKRSMGYKYEENEYTLYRFDKYCVENNISSLNLTKEDLLGWITKKDTEAGRTFNGRISMVRVFLLYMSSLGYKEYIPACSASPPKPLRHILGKDEIVAFFDKLDNLKLDHRFKDFARFENEYKVLFRLIYLCGLRISEACNITLDNYDHEKSFIIICDSKNNVDRMVYLSSDMNRQLQLYISNVLSKIIISQDKQWMFPGKDITKRITRETVERTFNKIWRSIGQKDCPVIYSVPPTVHDLRHTFITWKINKWTKDGVNVDQMRPYLMKYVGHRSLSSLHYYYHMVEDTNDIIYGHSKKIKLLDMDVSEYDWE